MKGQSERKLYGRIILAVFVALVVALVAIEAMGGTVASAGVLVTTVAGLVAALLGVDLFRGIRNGR